MLQTLLVATESPAQPLCRIHTDSAVWEPYAWRNAYVYDGTTLTTHRAGYCNAGKGPWAFTSNNMTVDECEAKCRRLSCQCFDYFCENHVSPDCRCPPPVPSPPPLPTATKVAAVGDSITEGYLSQCGQNYPNQLQALLGSSYAVTNYGVGGTTLLRKGDNPYWNHTQFHAAVASAADVVVMMLGTNDAKSNNWPVHGQDYQADYAALIDVFKSMPSQPTLLLMTPPPLYRDGRYGMLQYVINTELPRLVPAAAAAKGLDAPIDLFSMYERHCPILSGTPGHPPNATDLPCDWIGCGGVDACHPDNAGYGQIARVVREAILAVSYPRRAGGG